jgi:DNA repair protein RecN (Recombination protein N)
LKNELSDKIQLAMTNDEDIEKLYIEINEGKTELEKLAAELSENRKKVIPEIEHSVISTLAEMGMGNAVLKIEQKVGKSESPEVRKSESQKSTTINLPDFRTSGPPDSSLTKNGIDEILFLFTANKGHKLAEMSKVASGGELSRLMLSIKSIIAQNTALPTIIFDEIDTGVSGEVANKVGQIMERLSRNLQVITITHLPQIASKGKSHYFVYKDEEGAATFTRIKQLNNQERVLEIAKMLSGDKPGESALQNARELLTPLAP